jgi:hypothetical protein
MKFNVVLELAVLCQRQELIGGEVEMVCGELICGFGVVVLVLWFVIGRDTMDEMDVELWSRLPLEIVERTLLFLPVPVLCRFRTVCKSWNSLICKPAFGALNVQHARREACFLVARYVNGDEEMDALFDPFEKKHGWSFLDLNARRWYTIMQDGQEVFDRFQRGSEVAMDGGLVCQCLEADGDRDVSIFVCNPIAKTSRRLPAFPYSDRLTDVLDLVVLNMVVDSSALGYKIFVMPNGEDGDLRSATYPLMMIYESTSNQWWMPAHPPMRQITEDCIHVQCSVFVDGMLYILMCSDVEYAVEQWLWSYNHAENTWTDTGVTISMELSNPQLLVSDNRLFLGSWLRKLSNSDGGGGRRKRNAPRWSYELSEVLLESRTRNSVFRMAGAVLEDFFALPAYTSKVRGRFAPFSLNALGFCKSIVLLCESSGVYKLYDLSTCSWDVLPKHPLDLLPKDGHILWYGNPMNLILPATLL